MDITTWADPIREIQPKQNTHLYMYLNIPSQVSLRVAVSAAGSNPYSEAIGITLQAKFSQQSPVVPGWSLLEVRNCMIGWHQPLEWEGVGTPLGGSTMNPTGTRVPWEGCVDARDHETTYLSNSMQKKNDNTHVHVRQNTAVFKTFTYATEHTPGKHLLKFDKQFNWNHSASKVQPTISSYTWLFSNGGKGLHVGVNSKAGERGCEHTPGRLDHGSNQDKGSLTGMWRHKWYNVIMILMVRNVFQIFHEWGKTTIHVS